MLVAGYEGKANPNPVHYSETRDQQPYGVVKAHTVPAKPGQPATQFNRVPGSSSRPHAGPHLEMMEVLDTLLHTIAKPRHHSHSSIDVVAAQQTDPSDYLFFVGTNH